jgi:hypothetical protein
MPVDLSMIGLDGQKAYYDRMESAARSNSMQVHAQAEQQTMQDNARMQALSDQASAALQNVGNRDPTSNMPSADESADSMKSYADPIDTVADIFMKGGAPQAGIELMKKASDIRKQESDMQNDEITRRKGRLEAIQSGAVVVGEKLGKAKNQSEWEQGIKEVEQAGIIEPHLMAQIKTMPYDPDVAAYFYDQAITASEQAKLDLQATGQQAVDQRAAVTASQAERRIKIEQSRDAETRRFHDLTTKAGGKSSAIPAPNSDTMKLAKHALLNGPFKGVDISGTAGSDFNAAADYVAGQAQQLVRDNKALDMTTATNQAVMRADASGAFQVTKGSDGLPYVGWGATPDKVKFETKGLSAETAMSLPPGIKSLGDASKTLKKGKYYNTARGPAKWNGKAWEQ